MLNSETKRRVDTDPAYSESISSAACSHFDGQRGQDAGGGVGSQGHFDLGAGVMAAEVATATPFGL